MADLEGFGTAIVNFGLVTARRLFVDAPETERLSRWCRLRPALYDNYTVKIPGKDYLQIDNFMLYYINTKANKVTVSNKAININKNYAADHISW